MMAEQPSPEAMYLAGAPTTALLHLNAAGSTLVKDGPGGVMSINVNTASGGASSLTLYDGVDATGAVLGVIDCTKQGSEGGMTAWPFQTGLFLTLTGSPDITIIWR